jgi:signal transduction histidine kinase
VIENLVTNAVEAMDGRGRLLLRTEEPEDAAGNPRIVFAVSDTGGGMSEEFLRDRLFRPFATTKEKGMGLGLYQCRAVVRAHGGTLTAESRPGAGTTFRLTLPPAGREAAAVATEPVLVAREVLS